MTLKSGTILAEQATTVVLVGLDQREVVSCRVTGKPAARIVVRQLDSSEEKRVTTTLEPSQENRDCRPPLTDTNTATPLEWTKEVVYATAPKTRYSYLCR